MEPSGVNLNELLRITFTESIQWLTNQPDEEITIGWVALTLEEAQTGDALVLPSKHFDAGFAKRAKKQGVPAVLVVGDRQPKIADSDSLAVPLIFIKTGASPRAIQRNLARSLTNLQAVSIERGLSIHKQLSELAADGVQIEGLARAMHEITSRGILIHDKRLNVIADFPSTDLQSIWVEIIDQLSGLENLPSALQDRGRTGQQSMFLHQNISGGISRIIAPIIVGSVARGYLSVIGIEGTLDTLDQFVAVEGALVCAIEMSRAKAIRETEKRLQSDLLTALLQEDLSPREAGLWVEAMGLDQTLAHAALQFAWDSPSPPSRRRLETMIHGEVVRLGVKVIVNPAGKNVICFCQIPLGEKRPQMALDLGKNVLDQSKIEFPDIPIRCGIGSPVTNLNKWHSSFREAGQALDMAARLDETRPLYYPDLSVYRLLMLIENNAEVRAYQEDIFGPLLEHENITTFIETLEAYFEHQGNLSRAAAALFVHRNTLSYRLERIAEIGDFNLNNPDTALSVQLALKIIRMLDSDQ